MEPLHRPLVITIDGELDPAALLTLCDQIRSGYEGSVVCDVAGLTRPDIAVVGGLARLRLAARRRGHTFRLRNAGADLRRLLVLAGLHEVLPVEGISTVETVGQTEEWEQPLGIEEEDQAADLPAGHVDHL